MSMVDRESSGAVLPDAVRERFVHMLENHELELPVLPEVPARVIQVSFDEHCDIKQLTDLIQRDQSMTAHVLRVANSVMFAAAMPIVSLSQALNRLGLNKIREMALMISCESRVFRVDGFDLVVRGLFRHSVAAATYAEEIARLRRWNVEEAFLAGMLADVGRPVIIQTLSDIRKKLDVELEREAMLAAADQFHCTVGAELVSNWQLPARLAETILYHHDPEGAEEASQTAMLTRLASDFAHWLVGPDEFTEDELRAHPLLAGLNMYPDELDKLLAKKDIILEQVDQIT